MLDYTIFAVYTKEDSIMGTVAIAEKIHASYNLASKVTGLNMITLNVCKTWKEAQKLADFWNECFKKNGKQKI